MMPVEHFQIAERFRGPPRSGNGGYTCGRIARHLHGTVAVRLKLPPPISTGLRLEYADDEARLFHGAALVAEGKRAQLDLAVPPGPSYAEAEEASKSFIGFKAHNFPGCFVCGPARESADGLRIFPGQVPGGAVLAAPWQPDVSLAGDSTRVNPEFLWSALDCTGAFAVLPLEGRCGHRSWRALCIHQGRDHTGGALRCDGVAAWSRGPQASGGVGGLR